MKVEQFQKRAKRAYLLLDLPEPELVDLKAGSIKLRIQLSEERFIDVYFNEKTDAELRDDREGTPYLRNKRLWG